MAYKGEAGINKNIIVSNKYILTSSSNIPEYNDTIRFSLPRTCVEINQKFLAINKVGEKSLKTVTKAYEISTIKHYTNGSKPHTLGYSKNPLKQCS